VKRSPCRARSARANKRRSSVPGRPAPSAGRRSARDELDRASQHELLIRRRVRATAPSTARGLDVNEVPNSIQLTTVSSSPRSSRARMSRSWRSIQVGHARSSCAAVSALRPGGSLPASSSESAGPR
jgi:hypothetical protein